jgi:hypothetical protein
VVLAWIFDVNLGAKEGRIERTDAKGAPARRSWTWPVLIAVGLVASAPGLVFYLWLRPGVRAAKVTGKETEAELLNLLAKTPGLKVAGRTSSFGSSERRLPQRA